MEHYVTVSFGPDNEFEFRLRDPEQGLDQEAAHRWLDEELSKMGEDASNPVGKSLAADKILRAARGAGEDEFGRRSEWAMQLLCCACVLIGRANLTIDVPNATVGY